MDTITEKVPNSNEIHIHYKIVNDTAYHLGTPDEVVKIIEEARQSTSKLRFCFGDPETGRDWEEIYDTAGYIRRSAGSIKIPLLIKKTTNSGGDGLLDHCIVKIEKRRYMRYIMVWTHPKYHKDPNYSPDCPLQIPIRDDLNPTVLKVATNLGWTYNNPKDIGRCRTFTKSYAHIWSCIHGNKGPMWARANLIDGRHKNHRYYYKLLDALKGVNVNVRL